MSKYIDADKLIAYIERYKQGATIARFDNAGENADYFQGKVDSCDDLTRIIASLQQEQPELPPNLDEAAEEYSLDVKAKPYGNIVKEAFKDGATWRDSQIPELPSNLDEAAEEYSYNNWESEDYYDGAKEGLPFDAIGYTAKCFKAGAVWMAGQFQKIEGKLVDWYETNGVEYCHGISTNESFEVPEGFYIKKK